MGISTRWLIAATLFAASGCVVPGNFVGGNAATAIQPASVVATWNPRVVYTPDPANNGIPGPGLAGRLYLFGPTPDFPLSGDGTATIDLYDDTPRNGQQSSIQLEQWQFDAVTMKRLLKKDAIGMGYTLFLPWGTYRPDIKQIHLSVRFDPTTGTPVYAPSGPMTLEHGTPSVGPMGGH